jgi:hypothetical protein
MNEFFAVPLGKKASPMPSFLSAVPADDLKGRGFSRAACLPFFSAVLSVARLSLGEEAQRRTCFSLRRLAEVGAR